MTLAQLAMFIAVFCDVIMGVSRRMGNMIINLLSILVGWAFRDGRRNLSSEQSSTLDQILLTIAYVFSKFNLDGQTTTYAVCPKCHYTNIPTLLVNHRYIPYSLWKWAQPRFRDLQ